MSQIEIGFCESDMVVKTLSSPDEMEQAYRLRHEVFAQTLKWVPPTNDGLEMDMYDLWGASIGLVGQDGHLLGLARLLPSSGPFMLEQDLRLLLPEGHIVRKERDTAEITRLAIDPTITDKGLSSRLLLSLIKGIYQWALAHGIRYLYLEVDHRFFRVLQAMDIPCALLGPPVVIPPAGTVSVAATMDIINCEQVLARRRPKLMEWLATMTTLQGEVLTGCTSHRETAQRGLGSQTEQVPMFRPAA